MSLRLENRVAVVTGGTGALGRAVVRRLLSAGASVHATYRESHEADALRSYLGDAAAKVTLHEVDLTREKKLRDLYADVARKDKRFDVLANIAGGFGAGTIEDTSLEEWERMFAMNATTAFVSCRAAVPHMRERRAGRIVNVASGPALHRGAAGMSAYAASKAAVLNLTYSLAQELAPDGITVNAIVPSILDTPANRKAMPDADTATWLRTEEIAEVVGFLASAAGGIVTGSALNLERQIGGPE